MTELSINTELKIVLILISVMIRSSQQIWKYRITLHTSAESACGTLLCTYIKRTYRSCPNFDHQSIQHKVYQYN